ncbi:MAG: YCF48-related protein, partial [Pirellulaceae bacterium]
MPGQGRRRACVIHVITVIVSAMLPVICAAQWTDWPQPRSWQADAELTDICFVDRDLGWVTGDRGLLLKTSDGGRHWETLNLGIDCRLESVFFISDTHGWVAGGYYHPQGTTSMGVLFQTTDGGVTWKQLKGITIPKINQIRFISPHEGIAIGEGNAGQPAGYYETLDGGRSWAGITHGEIRTWRTASFVGDSVVMAGDTGDLAVDREGEIRPAYVVNTEPCVVRDLVMMDDRYGFAVGDNGQVLQTQNGGLSWQPTELAQGLPTAKVDYRTLCQRGQSVWIAGCPGHRIWRMHADQRQWQAAETHVRLPINCIHFVDDQYGWAVSGGGDVIHSSDGGSTWSMQRRGSTGVALLQIVQQPQDLIPELFASYCAEENYLGGALLIQRNDSPQPVDDVRQAISRVGGSFVRPVVINGDEADPAARLQEELVQQIRVLRPRVILIRTAQQLGDSDNFQSAVLAAVQAAADLNKYPEQLAGFGLQPWQIGKVVTMSYGKAGSQRVSPGQYLTSQGALTGDLAIPSRLLLGQHYEAQTVVLNTVFTNPWAAGPTNSLFASIEQMDAEIPRRRGEKNTAGNLAQMRKLASKRKIFDSFMELAPQQSQSAAIWNTNLAELVSQLDPPTAGVWLFELAHRCQREGYNYLAVQTLLYLTDNFRKHPLAVASLRWLYHEYSSGERAHVAVRRLQELTQADRIDSAIPGGIASRPITRIVDGIPMTTWELVEDDEGQEVVAAAWTVEQTATAITRRFQQARAFSQNLQTLDQTALHAGRGNLSRISLNRKLNTQVSADSQLKEIVQNPAVRNPEIREALARVANVELGLLNASQPASAMPDQVTCHQTATRPWLDGKLDDPVWLAATESGSRLMLRTIHSNTEADQLWISCDEEFLYLAMRCRKLNGTRLADPTQRRSRDSNLLDSDRVEISIDTDRDYSSSFLLTVDSSGQVADSLGNDLAWNPQWYVAAGTEGEFWTAELAIPLNELGDQLRREVWAISASRYLRNQLVSTC